MAGKLGDLIHSATNSPAYAVDESMLKAIKALVRTSDDNVKQAADLLMDRLGKNHSQIRYLALLIVDELFIRSKLFRNEIVSVLENLFLLVLGHRGDKALPPPADRATILKAKALEIIEKWNDMFGVHYKQLRLGYEYLKNTLRLNFPGVREAATRAEEERNARERRTQDLLRCRLLQLTENFAGLKKDSVSTIDQMEECFAILNDDNKDSIEFLADEADQEEFGVRRLRYARDSGEDLPPMESRDNAAVYAMVRDLLKLVATRHLPATQEWLSVLVRVDPEDRQGRDVLLKEVIDMRNRLLSLKSKCEELGIETIHRPKAFEEEDIEWEDEQVIDRTKLASATEEPTQQESTTSAEALVEKTVEHDMDDLKMELLREAPVLSWGSFLDSWGSEAAVPANTRGVVLDNHWGRVDHDALIPAEKLAQMQVRASFYQPEKSEIPPCGASLRNGGLCQRRDLYRCPLHGKIVPRDEQGNPIRDQCLNSKGKGKGVMTSREVAELALKNIQGERDKSDKKRKKIVQAKMDREHNEAVLRRAGLAHEMSYGETSSVEEVTKKKKRSGLSSMLKKKPTAKDRIARRLLTGRAAGATMNTLMRDEDAKYRESFSNQW